MLSCGVRVSDGRRRPLGRAGLKTILVPYLWLLVQAAVLFGSAGHARLPRAWLYVALSFAASTCGALFFWRVAPELANERSRAGEGTKHWDVTILGLRFLVTLLVVPAVAGLDIGWFHWSTTRSATEAGIATPGALLGALLYILGCVIVYWSMSANPFFEGTSRIQRDRGHEVVTAGPYKIVRHPGYAGMILGDLAVPVILGSALALIPAVVAVTLTVIRTVLEDRMLAEELDRYREYAKKVVHRLIPGVW